eukprot:CAMPEP_0194140712 /NCGR_PEP_ID=MMETSP0152-20130528/10229_1 /TAXON_ID=1049557 /ORGANISM="Thalassiothrix antarctica, Strain L6-D1" /LENGTH=232 /DNA_ID=CAMNT_0038839067 /DNA_START=100 /DNA_END=799 /DNA_ORIENTATION=+
MVAGAASSLLLPSCITNRRAANAASPPLGNLERVPGIGNGFDMLVDKPLKDIDILYPPSLNGSGYASGRLYRSKEMPIKLGDVFDRGYEIEERTGGKAAGATVVQWDPRTPNTLKYKKSDGSPGTELKVVQRTVEPQNNKGSLVGSNELIRVTTTTSASFGSASIAIIYATRVQRRWRRGTTEDGSRVVEGLEIVKTYRVLDGIAGIELPTSTVKSKIRLTRTYATRGSMTE